MGKRLYMGFILLFVTGVILQAQGLSRLPQIDPVLADMKGSPKSGIGLSLLASMDSQSATIQWVRASYIIRGMGAAVEVYVVSKARTLAFGPPNVAGLFNEKGASLVPGSSFGYALLQGSPCYLQTRKNGVWFLFVFPDESGVDVAAFIRQFNDCYAFFENRLVGAGPAQCFPAFVGMLQGVR